jgi:ectoine hydroxylase-related dioxygenase (phytanoyl-CoA dioxygenase family)
MEASVGCVPQLLGGKACRLRALTPSPSLPEPNPIINALVFLDDQTRENGCLKVVPKSHLSAPRGPLDLRREFPDVPAAHLEERGYCGPLPGEVALVCPAGSLVLLDHFTLHGSETNSSAASRRLISLGYGAPCVSQDGGVPASVLVRGARLPFEGGDYTRHVFSQ